MRIAGNVEAWQKEKVTGNGLVQAYGAEISGSLINKSSPLYYNKVLWVFQLNNATVRVKSCSDPVHKKGLYSANT